jgi:excisionase family DNA binding protein
MKAQLEQEDIQAIAQAVTEILRPVVERHDVSIVAVTAEQASIMLSCSEGHIRGMIKRGELPAARIGGIVRIPVHEVDRLLKDCIGGQNTGV